MNESAIAQLSCARRHPLKSQHGVLAQLGISLPDVRPDGTVQKPAIGTITLNDPALNRPQRFSILNFGLPRTGSQTALHDASIDPVMSWVELGTFILDLCSVSLLSLSSACRAVRFPHGPTRTDDRCTIVRSL